MKRRSFECVAKIEFAGEFHRCHRCSGCVALRAWLSSLRIELEAHGHKGRVWLCTLTFKEPVVDERVSYALVQKWLKRVRKNASSGSVRYTCVSELGGRRGRFHYHLVLYCQDDLKWRDLNSWDAGFSHFKLVGAHAAAMYVGKYLSKGSGKVRSSQKLGVATVENVNEACAEVYESFPGAKLVSIAGTKVPKELSARSHVFVPLSEIPRYEDTLPDGPDRTEERNSWKQLRDIVNKQYSLRHKDEK